MVLAIEFEPSSFLTLLLVGAVTTTLMLRMYVAKRKQQLREKHAPKPEKARPVQTPHEVLRWQVEMHDFTREVQGRLDNKIAMLQQLLTAADERIARLSELEAERLQSQIRSVADPVYAEEETTDADPYARDTARYAVVFGMADAGQTPITIARRLALPLGEVELMLSLRRRLPERPAA